MSVHPVWIPACLPGSGTKPTSQTRPGVCNTSLEPSRQKNLIHEKKIPLRAHQAPAVRKKCYTHYISCLKTTF